MTVREYTKQYKQLSKKEMPSVFNKFSFMDRKYFLARLNDDEREKFINDIRKQAVKDFWTDEQELIKQGKCIRDWTPEQIEDILYISEKTGTMSIL